MLPLAFLRSRAATVSEGVIRPPSLRRRDLNPDLPLRRGSWYPFHHDGLRADGGGRTRCLRLTMAAHFQMCFVGMCEKGLNNGPASPSPGPPRFLTAHRTLLAGAGTGRGYLLNEGLSQPRTRFSTRRYVPLRPAPAPPRPESNRSDLASEAKRQIRCRGIGPHCGPGLGSQAAAGVTTGALYPLSYRPSTRGV